MGNLSALYGSRDQTLLPLQPNFYLSLLNNGIPDCIVIMVDYRSLLLRLTSHVPSIIFGINSYK